MTLIVLLGILILIWMANYVLGSLFPHKMQRGVLFLFFGVLGIAISVLLFKILKSLFFVAIPAAIFLSFLVVTRRK